MTRKENVRLIKKLIEEKINQRLAYSELVSFLKGKGLSAQMIESLVAGLKLHEGEWLTFLNEFLAAKIKTIPGFDFREKSKRVALVGPTGVGKTTIALKLANFYRKKKKVALLSLDHEKGGAFAQLEKWATLWKLPLYPDPLEIPDEIELLLIDTSGCNTYEEEGVDHLGRVLSKIPQLEIHLILSAAAKEVDLYGAIHQFSAFNPVSILMTKWDETLASGVVLSLADRVDLPISFVAYGYPLPGKIEPASSFEIAHKILTDLNAEEYQFLRKLSL